MEYLFLDEVNKVIKELFRENNLKKKSQEAYKRKINKFFSEYMGKETNVNKPLNAITYYDIDIFLQELRSSDADKLNNYNALKRFFSFTYEKGYTGDIMSQVIKPICTRKPHKVMDAGSYDKLTQFIVSENNNLVERLVLGLFIYTGLSRKYIANIQNNHFVIKRGLYFLIIWKDEEEVVLPLKAELQLLIKEYCLTLSEEKKFCKVIGIDENSVSTYVGKLTEKATGKKFTPTVLSNTFISKALLNGNYIWEVSKLTLERVSTIEEHIGDIEDLIHRQTSILNSF